MPARSSFVVVANRLPVDQVTAADGSIGWRRSPGGLVTALDPVMRNNDGAWVGWSGSPGEQVAPFDDDGLHLVPVTLTADEVELYYEGFSNGTLWPLYHDVVAPPRFHRHWWDAYVRVNDRFAEAAAEVADEGAVVWVQDYQLQLVPAMLRERRPDLKIGFFLHIPFPPVELFSQLPWRRQIVEGLLGADLVGFQSAGGAANFVRLTRSLTRYPARLDTVDVDGREVKAGAFPISIDFEGLDALARTPGVEKRAEEIRHELGSPRHVLLGIDRLDYTKGIGQRLRAFSELLRDDLVRVPETVLVQVATPSRERVAQYRLLRDEIEKQVGRINGDYGRLGVPAVHYLHQSYDREEMAALYRAADVMVVTPLRDGMNLVAKEYVAARVDDAGTLILSEFAGAARELKQALLVNPHDVDGLKAAILHAIQMPPREASRRIRRMRRQVERNDVNRWAQTFLDTLRELPT